MILTVGRVHLLRQCVENVLSKVSPATAEIVIWSNGATDGTTEYLNSLQEPRIQVVNHPTNVGMNAYVDAFAMTTAPYLIELDDDVIDAPQDWDLTLLGAYQRLPTVGFLASGLVDNPHDLTSRAMYDVHEYSEAHENGVRVWYGPTGGYCAMTSRELYEQVGGFCRDRRIFFLEDEGYIQKIERAGYRAATLPDLEVLHASGPHYSEAPPEKVEFWREYERRVARKMAVKRVLLAVPGFAPMNARFGWFKPPEQAS